MSAFDRCLIHIPIDPTHIRGDRGDGRAARRDGRQQGCVGWENVFENEETSRHQRIGEVGGQKGVDPFPRKPELSACRSETASVFQPRGIASSIGV